MMKFTENSNSIHRVIYKNYLSSSLIPIFTIEVILLLLYFGVSYFITQKSQEMLFMEASKNLQEITKREAQQIEHQLQDVSNLALMMQHDHERFAKSTQCVLPNGEPSFAVHENGSYYKAIDNGGSSIYYASTTPLGEKEKLKTKCSEVIDPLMKDIVDIYPIITQAYYNTYDDLNRLYPFMKDSPAQYGPNLHMIDYNFYYLADAAHNPNRGRVWTSAYLDPAGQGWMLSNIVPIYNGDFLEGVSGLDVTIDSFIRNILNLDLPWQGSAFMLDANGMILAMPERIEKIFNLKELKEHIYEDAIKTTIEKPQEYNILKTPNMTIRKQIESFFTTKSDLIEIMINGEEYIITQKIVPETGWRLMILLNKSVLFESIHKLKIQIDNIGYIIIFLMVLFYVVFFLFLSKKSKTVASRISKPIHQLSILTKDLGTKTDSQIDSNSGIYEVDQLSQNFNKLSKELDERTNDYIQAQIREKTAEKDAEIAYRSGLFESASSYLHNVGNSLTMLDAKIRLMKDVLLALKNSTLGFKKLQKLIDSSAATTPQKEELENFIDKFDNAISNDMFSEIQEITTDIQNIKDHSVESIRHQQDVFNDSNAASKNYIQHFDIRYMIETLVEDYHDTCLNKHIDMRFDCLESLEIDTMKFQFHSGINNVLKNAIESIEESQQKNSGKISILATKKDNVIKITISDNGLGATAENLPKIFKAGFTTKKGGHGLGLHAFNNFLNTHKGKIQIQSKGLETGATISIEIGINQDEQ